MNVANINECNMIPMEMSDDLDLNEIDKIERNMYILVFIAYVLGLSSEETHKVIDKYKQAKRFPNLLTHPPTQILVRDRAPRSFPTEVKKPDDVKIGQYMPVHPQFIFFNNLQRTATVDKTDGGALAYAKRVQCSIMSDPGNEP